MSTKLKLVGASRYISEATGPDVIEKNGTATVDDSAVAALLAETRTDSLNNEHPVWVRVEQPVDTAQVESASVEEAEEETVVEAEDKPTAARRARK